MGASVKDREQCKPVVGGIQVLHRPDRHEATELLDPSLAQGLKGLFWDLGPWQENHEVKRLCAPCGVPFGQGTWMGCKGAKSIDG